MNVTDYTHLINKPDAINERHSEALDKIIDEFPYFQSARIIRLKHLYNQDSFKYNHALKVAATFTTDRTVLFDFITSNNFITVQNELYDKKIATLLNMNVYDSQVVKFQTIENEASIAEKSILSLIENANQNLIEEKLEIGKPLEFSKQETHSFQEWLQLSRFKPVERIENLEIENLEKKKKLDLIDKFIQVNPKIPQLDKTSQSYTKESINEDKTYLMTETLAKVYLEQKKYQRAIQAYEILILKYPEKSSFFANRISDIHTLQQNNS